MKLISSSHSPHPSPRPLSFSSIWCWAKHYLQTLISYRLTTQMIFTEVMDWWSHFSYLSVPLIRNYRMRLTNFCEVQKVVRLTRISKGQGNLLQRSRDQPCWFHKSCFLRSCPIPTFRDFRTFGIFILDPFGWKGPKSNFYTFLPYLTENHSFLFWYTIVMHFIIAQQPYPAKYLSAFFNTAAFW